MTKQEVEDLLSTNDRAVERALVLLYHRQTRDEQASQSTTHRNGRGFTGCDAEIFSSFAQRIIGGRNLTEKQMAVCRKVTKYGTRLGIYWKQLSEEADAKAQRIAALAA